MANGNVNIDLVQRGVRFENVSALMLPKEGLAEFMGLTVDEFDRFKARHNIQRVPGTSKYSTLAAIEAYAGEINMPMEAEVEEDKGLAALRGLSV